MGATNSARPLKTSRRAHAGRPKSMIQIGRDDLSGRRVVRKAPLCCPVASLQGGSTSTLLLFGRRRCCLSSPSIPASPSKPAGLCKLPSLVVTQLAN